MNGAGYLECVLKAMKLLYIGQDSLTKPASLGPQMAMNTAWSLLKVCGTTK